MPTSAILSRTAEAAALSECVRFCRSKGAERIFAAFHGPIEPDIADWLDRNGPANGLAYLAVRRASGGRMGALPVVGLEEAVRTGVRTAVIIIDRAFMPQLMRWMEALAKTDTFIVPSNPEWLISADLRRLSLHEAVFKTTNAASYLGQSGMKGHYLEFGTFWGWQFLPAYATYQQILSGRFYAFDSFQGLSTPDPLETTYTPDFQEGNYCCNQQTFEIMAEYAGCDASRLAVVPGFFSDTLVGRRGSDYGIEPESVSVCVIDCDLEEPTRQVLDFVTDLLEPGALLYFDDWRYCRASPEVGERGAALRWLKDNPAIELVEFDRTRWQNQWFVFQRRGWRPSPVSASATKEPAFGAAASVGTAPVSPRARHAAEAVRRDGFVLCPKFLSPPDTAQLGEWWGTAKATLDPGSRTQESIFTPFSNGYLPGRHSDDYFDNLHKNPTLIDIARACLGDDICHYFSRLLLKDDFVKSPIQCHQDWPYFSGGTNKLAIMIPVTRHTEDNGKLYFVKGSHHFGPLPRGVIDYEKFPEMQRVGPDLEIGDVLVFDFLTWHYSVPSIDGTDRGVIQIVYQNAADPSSRDVVHGRSRSGSFCRNWFDAMLRVDAMYSVEHARRFWRSGDGEAATKICKGVAIWNDGSALSALALMAEIALEEGRRDEAAELIQRMRREHGEMERAMEALADRLG